MATREARLSVELEFQEGMRKCYFRSRLFVVFTSGVGLPSVPDCSWDLR